MNSTIYKGVCNVIGVPNPNQYIKLYEYEVKTQKAKLVRNWSRNCRKELLKPPWAPSDKICSCYMYLLSVALAICACYVRSTVFWQILTNIGQILWNINKRCSSNINNWPFFPKEHVKLLKMFRETKSEVVFGVTKPYTIDIKYY